MGVKKERKKRKKERKSKHTNIDLRVFFNTNGSQCNKTFTAVIYVFAKLLSSIVTVSLIRESNGTAHFLNYHRGHH